MSVLAAAGAVVGLVAGVVRAGAAPVWAGASCLR